MVFSESLRTRERRKICHLSHRGGSPLAVRAWAQSPKPLRNSSTACISKVLFEVPSDFLASPGCDGRGLKARITSHLSVCRGCWDKPRIYHATFTRSRTFQLVGKPERKRSSMEAAWQRKDERDRKSQEGRKRSGSAGRDWEDKVRPPGGSLQRPFSDTLEPHSSSREHADGAGGVAQW